MRIFTSITTVICSLTLFLCAGAYLLLPAPAAAQVSVHVNGGSGSQAEHTIITINDDIRANLQLLVDKEYVHDRAAQAASSRGLQVYQETILNAVASGLNGQPFWIQNIEIFKAGVKANRFNADVESLSGSGICDAFRDDIIVELRRSYIAKNAQSVAQQQSCALDEATDNDTRAFLRGKANIQGIWKATTNPGATPRGKYLDLEVTLTENSEEGVENALIEIGHGDGFQSRYESNQSIIACKGQRNINGISDRCVITTPAAIMREQAAEILNIQTAIKSNNDEIFEETASALGDQMVQSTLSRGFTGRGLPLTTTPPPPNTTNPGGAFDCTDLDPLSRGNAFPCVPNDIQQPATQSFIVEVTTNLSRVSATSTNPTVPYLLRTLTRFNDQLKTIELVNNIEAIHASTSARYAPYNCFSLPFSTTLSNHRYVNTLQLSNVIRATKELYALFVRYEQAVDNNASTAEIVSDLQYVLSTNTFIPQSQADLDALTEAYNYFLSSSVAPFSEQMNQQVQACELIINPPTTP